MGKPAADPDALGVEAAAGAEEVEASPPLTCKGVKPGGGAMKLLKRDTPVTMLVGTGAIGAPPNTGTKVRGTCSIPEPPVGRTSRG